MVKRKVTFVCPPLGLEFKLAWYDGTCADAIKSSIVQKLQRARRTVGDCRITEVRPSDFYLQDEDGDEIVLASTLPDRGRFNLRLRSKLWGFSCAFSYIENDTLSEILAFLPPSCIGSAASTNLR